MTKSEFLDFCDKYFENWIIEDVEGEVVVHTGMKFKSNELVFRHDVKSKIKGGRYNSSVKAIYRVKEPKI
jgi:hypothetical protein